MWCTVISAPFLLLCRFWSGLNLHACNVVQQQNKSLGLKDSTVHCSTRKRPSIGTILCPFSFDVHLLHQGGDGLPVWTNLSSPDCGFLFYPPRPHKISMQKLSAGVFLPAQFNVSLYSRPKEIRLRNTEVLPNMLLICRCVPEKSTGQISFHQLIRANVTCARFPFRV